MWNANRIKQLRFKLQKSQPDFAAEIGVRSTAVSRWERGKSKPSRLAVRQLDRLERSAQMNLESLDCDTRKKELP